MSITRAGRTFAARLNRRYAALFVGFIGFLVLMSVLSAVGVPDGIVAYMFIGTLAAIHIVIGITSRTMQVREYFVAGRSVPSVYNGMAAGAGWISGTGFIGIAGLIYLLGYDGLAFVLGMSGGFVLVVVLIAPYLRKSGAYTVSQFLAARFDSNVVRLASMIVLVACAFVLAAAQAQALGLIASRFLGVTYQTAIVASIGMVVLCILPGGMRAVTWTQVAQYIVLAIAFLVPAIWMSTLLTGVPVPQLLQGEAIGSIIQHEVSQGAASGFAAPLIGNGHETLNFFLLTLSLMVGTASMPHLLTRYVTTPTVREARSSVAWSLLFVAIIISAAPAYAMFVKWSVLELVERGLTADRIAEQAGWMIRWGLADGTLVRICGAAATSSEAIVSACGALGVNHIGFSDIALDADLVVLAAPEMMGLPFVARALVASGALVATLAALGGLMFTISTVLSHDGYYAMIDRNAPSGRRLIVARIVLVLVGVATALAALSQPGDVLSMVVWAFSLAASGLFPALVLGIWWKRANAWGACAGMISGFAVCVYYVCATRYGASQFFELWAPLSAATPEEIARFADLRTAWAAASGDAKDAAWLVFDEHARSIANWWGVSNFAAAAFGLPVGFLVNICVSLLTRAPSRATRDFVDQLRTPRGEPLIEEQAS